MEVWEGRSKKGRVRERKRVRGRREKREGKEGEFP